MATDWVDPDDAPEITDEMFNRAELSVGGEVLRPATGTLRKAGRPKSTSPKEHINIRLSQAVLDHFKAGGPGWQTRIDEALKKAAGIK
ncbi:hypothetical protein DKG74_11625 [Zavarzinia aquatilis]|uniref:BrnA antitoxin family protein n=1 Tax=Zavarzinia aquatilis TaxID=2211142 RepID=A0A317E6T9_9PROT|nr:hypothetical protein DKG74_11625 [Zavarzinia aquatilis]